MSLLSWEPVINPRGREKHGSDSECLRINKTHLVMDFGGHLWLKEKLLIDKGESDRAREKAGRRGLSPSSQPGHPQVQGEYRAVL